MGDGNVFCSLSDVMQDLQHKLDSDLSVFISSRTLKQNPKAEHCSELRAPGSGQEIGPEPYDIKRADYCPHLQCECQCFKFIPAANVM